LEVLPVHLLREIKPFIIWVYPPLLDYDVSMDELIDLVVVIPTSQDHQKQSPDAKVITVFVLMYLEFLVVRSQ
jgi:hypothetical protein